VAEVVVVGSLNVDLTLPVPRRPEGGETLLGEDLRRAPGGKGANQAVAAARLGRDVAMIGAVGDDPEGEWLLDLVAAEGVDVSAVRRVPAPTGHAVILLEPDGESTIVVSPGANGRLTPADVDAHQRLLAGARCVLAQHEVPVDTVARAAALTRGQFVLNPAPGRPVARDLLRRVDVLVPNRLELAAVLERPEPTGQAGVLALARELAGPSTVVVVTLGPDGALVVSGDAATPVPAPTVAAADTTAAGDSFCAGFVDALLDGADPVAAAGHAVQVAAVTVTRPGALDSLPRRDELRLPESR